MLQTGAPKVPRRIASSVWARSCCFTAARLRGSKKRSGRRTEAREHLAEHVGIGDVAILGEVCPVDGAHEPRHPGGIPAGTDDARREQAVARKHRRTPERQAMRRADALELAPHVASLDGKNIEWRIAPPLRGEDRTEEERAPAYWHAGGAQRLDPHGRRI